MNVRVRWKSKASHRLGFDVHSRAALLAVALCVCVSGCINSPSANEEFVANDAMDVIDAADTGGFDTVTEVDSIALFDAVEDQLVAGGPCDGVPDGTAIPTSIDTGSFHSCLTLNLGCVLCRGSNAAGQLGDGSTGSSVEWQAVPGIDDAVTVVAGGAHSCAIHLDGSVSCWGGNEAAQVTFPPSFDRPLSPMPVEGLPPIDALAAGEEHTCGLSGGDVWCWGNNEDGQLGMGNPGERSVPQLVTGVSDVRQLAAGRFHTCAVTNQNEVYCWGHFICGAPPDPLTAAPVLIEGMPAVGAIGAGFCQSVATASDESVYRWGEAGVDRVDGLGPSNQVSYGHFYGCALSDLGEVSCWGQNAFGELGQGHTNAVDGPVAVSLPTSAYWLVQDNSHVCVLLDDGSAWCWGPSEPSLGDFDQDVEHYSVPRQVW